MGTAEIPLDDLYVMLPTMDRQAIRLMAHNVLGLTTPAQQWSVSVADQVRAGLWEFMHAVGFVTDTQARGVLAFTHPAVEDAARVYAAGGAALPAFHVVFAERRWVGCPFRTTWYDMAYGKDVDSLPAPAVLLVTCDVTAMFLRQRAWLAKLPGGKDAGQQHHAGRAGR